MPYKRARAIIHQNDSELNDWLVEAKDKPNVVSEDSGSLAFSSALAPVSSLCIADSVLLTDPTFVRPSSGATTTCPASGNPTTHYKSYEFTLSANASVTANTCGTGACASAGTLDSVLFVYQKPDFSTGGIFNPASPCTNVIASNNNGCNPNASITTNLNAGNFVVVVTSNGASQQGTFNLSVDAPGATVALFTGCTYNISPSSKTVLASGVSDTVAVTAGVGCAWTAVSNNPSFIHVTSGSSGSGNGTVGYTVDANGGEARTGSITIAGFTFNITQEAGSVTLSCISDALVAGDSTFVRPSVAADGSSTCPGSGNPTVFYKAYEFTLSANASVTAQTCGTSPCSGAGTLADSLVYIYQKPDFSTGSIFLPGSPCTNVIKSNNNSCGLLSSATTNLNAGNFVVVVSSNGAGETGTFNLAVTSSAGTVALFGGCTYSINPLGDSFAAAGGSGNVTVTAPGGCAWTAVSNNPSFIHVTAGSSGSGNGSVSYTVDPNTGVARTGSITIAGLTFSITQAAGSVSLSCISDALVATDSTFVRPSAGAGGAAPTCPGSGNPTVFYKSYEFALSANASVTAQTCGTSPCSGIGTLANSVLYVYQKPDFSTGGIFNPASPCTNAVASDNDSCGAGPGDLLSTVTKNLSAGNFVVVVAANGAGETGTFNLAVTSTAGTLTPVLPDLIATKTNSVSGTASANTPWTWKVTIANQGNAGASFTSGQTILSDNLPNSSVAYGAVTVGTFANITNSGNISCSIASNNLTCSATGPVTIGALTGSFDISFSTTPSTTGSFANPRVGGVCFVDPGSTLIETSKANNSCTNTVTVVAADGSGTMTVSPTTALAGSSGQNFTFTYTAATGGMNNGAVTVQVPSGWSAPVLANVTASTGTASVASQTITVNGMTLSGGATMTIGYNNATVNSTAGPYTFDAQQKSLSGGTLTNLATSPSVTVTNAGTWTGNTSSVWNLASNWSPAAVPGPTNDVIIPAGALTNEPSLPAAGPDVTVHDLTVSAGHTLTINSGRILSVTGNWTNNGTAAVGAGTVAFIGNNNSQSLLGSTSFANLTINHTGTGSVTASGSTLIVTGLLRVQGGTFSSASTFNNVQIDNGTTLTGTNATTMNVSGNWTLNAGGTFTPNGNTVNFSGANNTQTITGTTTFDNLQINHTGTGGVTLSSNMSVNALLTLTSGIVTTNANTLSLAAVATRSRIGGYIIGNEKKSFGGNGSFTFDVGTLNAYSPVDATVTAGIGDLTVLAVQGPRSSLNASKSLQRYWTLIGAGPTSNLTFHYPGTDVMGNEGVYRIIRIEGSSFTSFPTTVINTSNPSDHTASLNSVNNFSDWTVGEPVAPTAATSTVSGRILDSDGNPVEGAVIRMNGTQDRKTITDSQGNYAFSEVETNGFYTVTPSRVNYNFAPATRGFSALGAHTEASFGATTNGNHQNPLDTTEYFVRQQYVDFLGREPEEKGLNDWTDTINNCASGDASCDRIHVSEAFFRSEEFQQRGYFVYRFYSTAFVQKPDYAAFAPDLARVSGFLDATQLEAAKAAFAYDFITRPAFALWYNSLSNSAYVNELSQTSGVTLSNRQALIDSLDNKTASRAQVLRQIAESNEVYARYYNQAFVVMEYFGYLRRDPDILYLNWISVLDANPADSRHLVEGFVDATEYRNRFKQ
jgi:hypothetical protein